MSSHRERKPEVSVSKSSSSPERSTSALGTVFPFNGNTRPIQNPINQFTTANQGSLSLNAMSLIGNTAQGGSSVVSIVTGGGGMGQDGISSGGGFGWASPPSGVGGKGGVSNGNGGGGGGGFIAGSDGGTGGVGTGGGKGGLGNHGPSAGDGGSAYTAALFSSCNGGDFGMGGVCFSGGGVGGGGGHAGGGGFGGGGGGSNVSTSGGFGGGGGYFFSAGGFGGGTGDGSTGGGGGGGFGGAIFNHTGTVYLLNVTATGNAAKGGTSLCATCGGSGLGAGLFNLNGNVTIDFSTLAGNFLSGNNGTSPTGEKGPEDGTVYSLAYGNKIQDGSASAASLTIHNSIVRGTHGDGGAGNDILVNVVDGTQANSSSVVYKGKNFVQFSANLGSVTQTGTSPTQADPLLGALSIYSASPSPLPVLPIGSNSLAYNTASSCLEADNSTALMTDERGAARPNVGTQCDVGAYEFDGDYIFADGADVKL